MAAKVNLTCNECGKKFKVSPNNPDPTCPKCGSVDFDVADVFAPRPVTRKVVFRNYATGPWDFHPEVA